ncbi:MAG: hypothetical protein U0V87_00170 [Acidobacteriota bacterium]
MGGSLNRIGGLGRRCWLVSLLCLVSACGKSYQPPQGEVTGRPSAPLGRVIDTNVLLPHLVVDARGGRGVTLEMTLRIDGIGDGRHEARYTIGKATAAGGNAQIEDLSNGKTIVTESAGSFQTGRIGPLRVGNTSFELLLQGIASDGGWNLQGSSWESQSGLEGTFTGWRRHRFLVTSSDFAFAGSVALIELRRGVEIAVSENLSMASADPYLRQTGGALFVINRLTFDNLQRLDPESNFATSWQAGVGSGSNPHDALWIDRDRVYVSRYEPPFDDLLVLDPHGGRSVSTIPLDALADNGDATPRADQLCAVGDTVFVGLQNIDRSFTRYGSAKLAVVDSRRDALEQAITLPGKNPGALRAVTGDDGRPRVYVALAGIFPGLLPQELSGGVAVVDVNNRSFERWALDDDVAGGNIAGLAVHSSRLAYATISTASYQQRVIAFDPQTNTVLRTLSSSNEFVPELEIDSAGVLAVPDRSFERPQVCLYAVPAAGQDVEARLGCARLNAPPFAIEPLD